MNEQFTVSTERCAGSMFTFKPYTLKNTKPLSKTCAFTSHASKPQIQTLQEIHQIDTFKAGDLGVPTWHMGIRFMRLRGMVQTQNRLSLCCDSYKKELSKALTMDVYGTRCCTGINIKIHKSISLFESIATKHTKIIHQHKTSGIKMQKHYNN